MLRIKSYLWRCLNAFAFCDAFIYKCGKTLDVVTVEINAENRFFAETSIQKKCGLGMNSLTFVYTEEREVTYMS